MRARGEGRCLGARVIATGLNRIGIGAGADDQAGLDGGSDARGLGLGRGPINLIRQNDI